MFPFGHLADGHMELLLLGKPSRWQGVKFIFQMATTGMDHLDFPFVQYIKVCLLSCALRTSRANESLYVVRVHGDDL